MPDNTITTYFRGGFRIPRRRGSQHTNLPDFPQKMHEIEKFLVRVGGGGRVGGTPLDPLLYLNY